MTSTPKSVARNVALIFSAAWTSALHWFFTSVSRLWLEVLLPHPMMWPGTWRAPCWQPPCNLVMRVLLRWSPPVWPSWRTTSLSRCAACRMRVSWPIRFLCYTQTQWSRHLKVQKNSQWFIVKRTVFLSASLSSQYTLVIPHWVLRLIARTRSFKNNHNNQKRVKRTPEQCQKYLNW